MIENNKSNTPKNKSKLLLDSNPLIILPELAVLIGLNESIILQQIHYWLQKSTHIFDGRVWVYNSIPQWCEQFPFWSEKTIKRAIGTLRNQGLLITGNYNDLKQDRTLWYTIDYAALEAIQQQPINPPHSSSGHFDPMEETEEEEPVNPRKYSSGQNDLMSRSNCLDDQPNLGRPLPEITSKITSEKINPSVCLSNRKQRMKT